MVSPLEPIGSMYGRADTPSYYGHETGQGFRNNWLKFFFKTSGKLPIVLEVR
jgi:hypothetical protein